MDDQIDIRFVNLETKFDIMQKFHNLNGDSLGDHLTWLLDLKEKQKKQEEFNANIVKRLEELEDKMAVAYTRIKGTEDFVATTTVQANIRFDQGIENRTKAFERIKELEDYNETYNEKHQTNKNYSFQRRIEKLEDYRVKTYLKLERIDDILVVHRNQSDSQRKNHANLIKVWDEKVIPLIEGTHGKQK